MQQKISHTIFATFLSATLCLSAPAAAAREPKPETLAAFYRYRDKTQARMDADVDSSRFLYIDRYSSSRRQAIEAELRRGEFYLEQLHTLDGQEKISVPGGLIHHWVGVAFLPNATLAGTEAVLEDYEHQKENYFPDVRQSKLLSQQGDKREVFLQFYSKTVVTAVFNVYFSTETRSYSPVCKQIRSCSDRVREAENFGRPEERELPPSDSHGYLWQLCTWWRIEETSGGTYIQVEAIELSRTVPFAFAWLVNPILRSVPKTFLSHLLSSTQKAVAAKSARATTAAASGCGVSGFASSCCRASTYPVSAGQLSSSRNDCAFECGSFVGGKPGCCWERKPGLL